MCRFVPCAKKLRSCDTARGHTRSDKHDEGTPAAAAVFQFQVCSASVSIPHQLNTAPSRKGGPPGFSRVGSSATGQGIMSCNSLQWGHGSLQRQPAAACRHQGSCSAALQELQ